MPDFSIFLNDGNMNANGTSMNKPTNWLGDNWFKIVIIVSIGWFLYQNNLSFTFNFNSPFNEQPANSNDLLPFSNDTKAREQYSQQLGGSTPVGGEQTTAFSFFKKAAPPLNLSSAITDVSPEVVQKYIARFAQVAISEQRKYGIPASVIVASAVYHSTAGTRQLTRNSENHFGIRCGDWSGETYQDARHNCYRKYNNAWSSFRDHSVYLTSGKFAAFRQLDGKDYRTWLKAMEANQVSESKNLAKHLQHIIERYDLETLDR